MSLVLAAASFMISLRLHLSVCPPTCLCIFTLHISVLKKEEGKDHAYSACFHMTDDTGPVGIKSKSSKSTHFTSVGQTSST